MISARSSGQCGFRPQSSGQYGHSLATWQLIRRAACFYTPRAFGPVPERLKRDAWMQFFSSSGLDRFLLDQFFRGRRGGVFLDLGARESDSSTLFFERSMGWRGLCAAISADTAGRLAAIRSAASATFDSTAPNALPDLLARHALAAIDYAALDLGSETSALLADLGTAPFRPSVVTIRSERDDPALVALLAPKGYEPVGRLGADSIFRRRDVARLAQTSVICAVWSGDPKRFDLLRGHIANLARQTVQVEPIYAFDGNDKIPPWVKGRAVASRERIGLYQAWNLALSLVDTPFVMNLNLDDRLAVDAVEVLERALGGSDAALVGGDWNITYSQKETDTIERCYPAELLPSVADWEQRGPGVRTRLGSGTGEQGTYGPATMWRLDAHIGAPRYPWRFPEGTVLRSAADAAWWLILADHLKRQLLRLPVVIGNYHYHPKEQAQYRALPHDEVALIGQLGVSLL